MATAGELQEKELSMKRSRDSAAVTRNAIQAFGVSVPMSLYRSGPLAW
eukprot:CAMPEP_0194496408 /NCGR_PEP_ID=MMETSP0253-20130528/13686_1 /TAXON_ID=2966 /ORGANISM="Noctiluca scintillans" /LENGTH=47 /DNA_ID= /DNA_START= /DNA_END= /DNA_ORIENTATION=